MSNKMKGLAVFRHHLRNWAFFDGLDNPSGNDKRATLVISDERVFTESEVRAKDEDLRWAMTWMRNEAGYLRESGTPQPALELAIEVVLERHGIVLDPA